jgi:hypothetical protein
MLYVHLQEIWLVNNVSCGRNIFITGSASFSCLSLFPHLIIKIQNYFICMCWRRMFCFSDHIPWETNLKSIPFKVVLSWKLCSCDVITRNVYWILISFFDIQILELCTAKLHLVTAARKVFLSDGTLVKDFHQINKNADIYISCGERFKDPFGKYIGE